MGHRLLPKPGLLIFTLLLTVLAAFPLAYLFTPHLMSRYYVSLVTHPDDYQRQRGLSYVLRHAAENEAVARRAAARLPSADSEYFLQILHVLDLTGQWRREVVGVTAWLRWIEMMIGDTEHVEARIAAAQHLADMFDIPDDSRLSSALSKLASDDHADVRYNALVAGAELLGAATDRRPYEALLRQATRDTDPTVAAQAWMFLGLLRLAQLEGHDWRHQPPAVAGVMLWAAVRTNPEQPSPAIDALGDESLEPAVRAMAAYALHMGKPSLTCEPLIRILNGGPHAVHEANQVLLWRAILSVPGFDAMGCEPARRHALDAFRPSGRNEIFLKPLALAAVYRLGLSESQLPSDDEAFDAWMRLAAVEGGQTDVDVDADCPDLLRLMAVASQADPSPQQLREFLDHPEATVRDLACVVAAGRLSKEQNTELVSALLRDFNDDAKRSGAILAGLTGAQPLERHHDMRAQRLIREDLWAVKQILRLGLWMRGQADPDGVDMDQAAPAMLSREDLPHSTVLLALLHRHHPAAWEHLFNPRGEPSEDLIELLDQKRWWLVLKLHLSEGAPPFWVWADPPLQRFQIDALRNWYLLNQHTMPQSPPGPPAKR